MKIKIKEIVEYKFDENNFKHCHQWLINNCSDVSFFPNQGKVIYNGDGYEVKNCENNKLYNCLYKLIKNKKPTLMNIKSRLSYFMSYGGEFIKCEC